MAALVVVALATRPNRVLGNLKNCQNLRKKVQIDLQTDTKLQIVGVLVGKNCTKTPVNLLLKFIVFKRLIKSLPPPFKQSLEKKLLCI